MTNTGPTLVVSLEAEHRELDELLGKVLAAADPDEAGRAIEEFDKRLRAHTRGEEERLYSPRSSGKLLPVDSESEEERLGREMRLEHVQIREVSGMMRRLFDGKQDFASARALWGNLARRWEAHTNREERDVFPLFHRHDQRQA